MKSNRKVSKPSRHAKPESISIQLKRPIVKPVAPSDTPSNTTLLAKQLRQRLAAAAAKLTAKDDFTDPADIDIVAEPTLSTSDWPPKTPALRNLNLLKQYLIFVSQENHTNVELNSEDHSIHFDFSNCNSEYVKTESVAHSGATLIESLVHGTNAMTNQLHLSKHEGRKTKQTKK
jgi:hypothetical protein